MKPQILVLSYLFPNPAAPNAGIFVCNRVKAVAKHHDVTVINPVPWFPFLSMLKKYREYGRIPAHEQVAGIDVYHPRFFSIPRYFKWVEAISYFLAVLPVALRVRARQDISLIDLHWTYPDLPAGYLLARLLRRKVLVTLRGMEAYHPGEISIRRLLIMKLIARMDFVIGLSRELLEVASKVFRDQRKMKVIRNGVDLDRFHFIGKEGARARIGFRNCDRIILSVGSLIYRKGFDRIISCLPGLLREFPGAVLVIVGGAGGEADFRPQLHELVQALHLEEHVAFVGAVANSELANWYNAADVFCLASRGEGDPNVLLEALACGCPSVATDVGSVREVLTDPALGEMVPNEDEALYDGLRRVLAGSYDRPLIAEAMQSCGWDRCGRQVVETYQAVLQESV